MNKRIAKGTVPKRVIFTGSLVLFCAFSFPFVVNAATAVPQPGESIRDTRPRQQVSLENLDTDNKQASQSVRFTLQEIRVEHEGLNVKDEKIAAITDKVTSKEITAAELYAADSLYTAFCPTLPAVPVYVTTEPFVPAPILFCFVASWFVTYVFDVVTLSPTAGGSSANALLQIIVPAIMANSNDFFIGVPRIPLIHLYKLYQNLARGVKV